MSELDWQDDALCAQVGTEMFFPNKGDSTQEAKRICANCPVAAQCLAYAISNHEIYGVWGGTTPRGRHEDVAA